MKKDTRMTGGHRNDKRFENSTQAIFKLYITHFPLPRHYRILPYYSHVFTPWSFIPIPSLPFPRLSRHSREGGNPEKELSKVVRITLFLVIESLYLYF